MPVDRGQRVKQLATGSAATDLPILTDGAGGAKVGTSLSATYQAEKDIPLEVSPTGIPRPDGGEKFFVTPTLLAVDIDDFFTKDI